MLMTVRVKRSSNSLNQIILTILNQKPPDTQNHNFKLKTINLIFRIKKISPFFVVILLELHAKQHKRL